MLVANDAFGEAVKEVYEPDWPGRDKLIQYLEVCNIIKHQFLRKWVYLHHQKKSQEVFHQICSFKVALWRHIWISF